MKKNNFIKSLLIGSVLLFGACSEDIINYNDPNTYNTDSYFNTPSQIEKAATAIYVSFYYNYMMGWRWPEVYNALGNEMDGTPGGIANEGDIVSFMKYQFNNTNVDVSGLWRMSYKMILRSNLVIYKAEQYQNEKGQNDIVTRSIGEAYFLRGWAYSQLAFNYGRVPIRTSLIQTGNIDAPRAASVDDVWAVAESNLKKAQEILPVAYDDANKGRATKGSATGYLGKLYLYTKKYAQAETEFAKLQGTYSLLAGNKWDQNFDEANENNSESLFEVQFSHRDGNFQWGNFDEPEGLSSSPSTDNAHVQLFTWGAVGGWNNWKFSAYQVPKFQYNDENGIKYTDPRAKLTFYGGIGDSTYLDNAPGGPKKYNFKGLGYYWRKHSNLENAPVTFLASGVNLRLLRYADVLLMRAEIKLESNDITGAIGYINQVRNRIGAFPYIKTYTKAEAFELLKRERFLELYGEQSRYNDLKRWGILEQTINPELQVVMGSQPILPKHYIFPIPQIEIDSNLGLGTVANDWN